MKVTKEAMERMCLAAGLQTQPRMNVEGKEVFIADGWSAPPHTNFSRFGLDKDEFPFGCYVTMWFTSARKSEIGMGRPLYFDALQMTSRNKDARIREAISDAQKQIKQDRKNKRLN